MLALGNHERRMLLRFGTMLALGGCAILPFTFSPSTVVANAQSIGESGAVRAPRVPGRLVFPEIAIERDPFTPTVAMQNANAGEPGAPTIRAIVLGEAPRALVDVGSGVQMLGIGDKLGADTIVEIDAKGVQLSGGARLALPAQP